MGFGHASSDSTDTDLGNKLHSDSRTRIDVLQVINQLCEIFDRVDVMVRRRRDETHTWNRVPQPRDYVVDLVPRKLPAFTRFRSLRHLDLKLVGVHEIVRGYAEARGSHLL